MSTHDDQPRPDGSPSDHASAAGSTATGGARKARRGHWSGRHKIVTGVMTFVLLIFLAFGGWLFYLNQMFGNIEQVAITVPQAGRPHHTGGKDLNILIAGADNGTGPSIAKDVAAGKWPQGAHRSDTIIIFHLSADRKHAYLISIPRDSYVKLYDGMGQYKYTDKVNGAFSLYGPSGYLSTIEHLTGLRMDHLAIIDWKGFKDLSTALGGVRVYIPHTFYDDSQKITWHKGWQNLSGEMALHYVRTRHGLSNGDFGRIARQQNFVRAMMQKLMDQGTLSNPIELTQALRAITSNLTVDSGWSGSNIRNLALSLRGLKQSDVTFLTAPMKAYGTTSSGESVVLLNKKQCAALWRSVANDNIDAYLKKYGKSTALGGAQSVN
ncbi:MAG: LCP family protein [Nocardioidaceae bacterium]